MLCQLQQVPFTQRTNVELEMIKQFEEMNSQFRQMQELGQIKEHQKKLYEVRIEELHSLAAQNGFNWTPPNY